MYRMHCANDSGRTLQSRKLRKSIADMQNSHEAQVNAVMDKYNSLCAKVSTVLLGPRGTAFWARGAGPADAIPLSTIVWDAVACLRMLGWSSQHMSHHSRSGIEKSFCLPVQRSLTRSEGLVLT